MIKKVTLERVQGAQVESMQLETRHIKRVGSNKKKDRCLVVLKSGHRIEVKGTIKEVRQTIREARKQ